MPKKLDLKDFSHFFEHFRHRAFRLETLDQYLVPEEQEMYARFLKGEAPPSSANDGWCQLVRRSIQSGKIMERVHVISIPPSQYVRFEIAWGYVQIAAAGEDVYLLNRRDMPEGRPGLGDFWLFDDQRLVLMGYDQDGRFLGASRESDLALVATYAESARILKSLSVPLAQYLGDNPLTER